MILIWLFSESNTRFLVEVKPQHADEFEELLRGSNVSVCRLGTIDAGDRITFSQNGNRVLDVTIADAKAAWLKPLNW